jgi:tetratricopeptide (TPR) repeat protein
MEEPPNRTNPGQLWQVPVFLAGVAAVVGVWFARPLWHATDAQLAERYLKAARRELAEPVPDWQRVAELAESALNLARSDEKNANLAKYLLGYACAGMAGQAPAQEAEPIWQRARAYLEEAGNLQVLPAADQGRFRYLLGKTRYQTGANPKDVIACLASSVEHGADDLFEGYRMLVECYLSLRPPDLQAALDANKKQLDLPKIGEQLLAPTRLSRGKILLQMKQPEEARKVLARIGRETPALFAEARLLRAQSCQQDELYQEAADLWQAILKDSPPEGKELGRIWFSLGDCFSQLGRPAEAVDAWQRALAQGGEAEQAAAFRLGQWQLNLSASASHKGESASGGVAAALESFKKALARVQSPGDYHNSLVDLKSAQQILEEACKNLRSRGDYEGSLKLADLYRTLAPPEAAQGLIGQAAAEWAKKLLERNDPATYKVYREAAVAFGKAAELAHDAADQAHWLWLSADAYLRGKDEGEAIVVLERFLQVDISEQRRGEAWLALGMVRQGLGQEEEAVNAYYKCIEFPGPNGFRARYRLAEIHIKQGKLDDAEKELEQNLELIQQDSNPDSEALEQSLFLLANLYYQRKSYRKASFRFQELLNRNDPRTTIIREKLADCYRNLAVQENAKQSFPPNINLYRQYMQAAEVNYEKLVDDLAGLEGTPKMTRDEEMIKHRAEFLSAQCKFDLGKYEDAARLYDLLADRYRYRLDGLTALKQLWQCYWLLHHPERARDTLRRIRSSLELMDENLFKDQPEGNSRQDWLKWLEEQEKK